MPVVTITPATPEDFAELAARSDWTPAVPPVRSIALVGKVDGRAVAIGGVAFFKNGQNVAFCDITDEGRKYPLSIHRAGLAAIALAKEHGLKHLVATGESNVASQRWLVRLGFKPVLTGYGVNYVLEL